MRKAMRGIGLAVALAAGASGQSGNQWQAPASGYVFDAYAKALRPVIGFVGSAHLGPPAHETDWASVGPDGKSAWLWKEGALQFAADAGAPDLTRAPEDWGKPLAIRWSADAQRCVLLMEGRAIVARRTGTGEWREERATAWTDGRERKLLAASADLRTVALNERTGEAGPWRLVLWGPEGEQAAAKEWGEIAAATMDEKSGALFVADGPAIWRVDAAGGTEPAMVLDASHGVGDAAALVISQDAAMLHVVERTARVVRSYDLTEKTVRAEIPLDESPEEAQLLGPRRYMLNGRSRRQQALLVLDLTGEPKVVFVPAGE
jgi:hypothetical protein